MIFVYVHMIEMTVFEEEAYELPFTLLDRDVDIVRVSHADCELQTLYQQSMLSTIQHNS